MNKKNVLALGLGILILGGGTAVGAKVLHPDTKPEIIEQKAEQSTEHTGDIINQGTILNIEGNKVSVLGGDIIEDYEVDKKNLGEFYLNQEVAVYGSEGNYSIKSVTTDYSYEFTTMGEPILSLKGEVTEFKKGEEYENTIKVESQGEVITVQYYGEGSFTKGQNVLIKYMERDNVKVAYTIYDVDKMVTVTVEELTRSEKGEMIIRTTDGDSHVVLSSTSVGVNLGDISQGDQLIISTDNEGRLVYITEETQDK